MNLLKIQYLMRKIVWKGNNSTNGWRTSSPTRWYAISYMRMMKSEEIGPHTTSTEFP